MIFIDWLTIMQAHRPGTVGLVGSEFVVSTSLETGEIVAERVKGFQHAGSYDTNLHVRCDGTVVYVSGNPSAFDRPDNLFGVLTVQDAVSVFNRVLESLGLPPFSNERPHEQMKSGYEVRFKLGSNRRGFVGAFRSDIGRQSAHYEKLVEDGRPRISRIDLTENLFTSDSMGFIRQISGYNHHGKSGYLYPNGKTTEWNKGSRRVYHKYYEKAHDIRAKIGELAKRVRFDSSGMIEQHINYLNRLLEFCETNGIVRREISLKSTELIDRSLNRIEAWSTAVMSNVIYPFQFHKKIRLEETRFDGISETLIAEGVSVRQARQAEMIHRSWVDGLDVKKLAGSDRTFRRYRKMLFRFGVDISVPCDISRIPLRVNTCDWKDAVVPSWYVLPGQERKEFERAA